MSEKEPQRVVGAPIWGIFLLFLGIVFLLQTLGVLPWGLWGTLWRFWPVLIIIIGVSILLRRYNVWLVSLLILAMLGACLGIAAWQYESPPPSGAATQSYSEPLGDIERAQIEVDFTAGSISISSLPPASPNFVQVTAEGKSRDGSINVDFQRHDGEGRLYLKTERGGARWEVRLATITPLAMNIKSAASNMELDLSQLKVTELKLDIDAGNCKLTMPSSAGTTRVNIKADVANVEVTIPDGVAAKVWVDTDLSALDVDQSRFPKQGDYYISGDFDTAQNRVYLEIDCDVSRVEVR
jgi:hypothetical protein